MTLLQTFHFITLNPELTRRSKDITRELASQASATMLPGLLQRTAGLRKKRAAWGLGSLVGPEGIAAVSLHPPAPLRLCTFGSRAWVPPTRCLGPGCPHRWRQMKPGGSRSPSEWPGSMVSREAELLPGVFFPWERGSRESSVHRMPLARGRGLQRLRGLRGVPRSLAYLSIRSTSARCSAASSVLSAWSSLSIGGVS